MLSFKKHFKIIIVCQGRLCLIKILIIIYQPVCIIHLARWCELTNFILLKQTWEIGNPHTGSAERVKLPYVK